MPRLCWLALVVLVAGAVVAGTALVRTRDEEVITFQYNHLSATMQSSLEVDSEVRAPASGPDPAARVPVEPTTVAAILAVAGLALVLQQRDRNRRS